jgi:hypothetical protein
MGATFRGLTVTGRLNFQAEFDEPQYSDDASVLVSDTSAPKLHVILTEHRAVVATQLVDLDHLWMVRRLRSLEQAVIESARVWTKAATG